MNTKAIWQSKTFWANIIALFAMLAQSLFGYVVTPEVQIAALAVVNLVLRAFTNSGVALSGDQDPWAQKGASRVSLLVAMQLGFVVALFAVLFTACVPTQGPRSQPTKAELATKTLASTQTSIVGLAQAANDLCAAGTIEQHQCQQISTLYEQSKGRYDLAADALLLAIEADTPDAWARHQVLFDRLQVLTKDISALTAH